MLLYMQIIKSKIHKDLGTQFFLKHISINNKLLLKLHAYDLIVVYRSQTNFLSKEKSDILELCYTVIKEE